MSGDGFSEIQAFNELAAALHDLRCGACSFFCMTDPTVSHGQAARALFEMGWRPAWWFHNPDGSTNGRPPVRYEPSTGRASR